MGILKYKLLDGWHTLYGGILQRVLFKDNNLSDLTNVGTARTNLELTGNVTTHYHQTYIDSIADLQGQIDLLKADKQDLYSKYNTLLTRVDNLTNRVSTLETVVGNNNSGLVKDVNDLKTTVGNANSGLVKQVNTNTSDIAALKTTVGNATSGLVKRVTDLENTINDSTTGLSARVTALEDRPRIYVETSAPSNARNKDVWIDSTNNLECIQAKVSNSWKKIGAYWK